MNYIDIELLHQEIVISKNAGHLTKKAALMIRDIVVDVGIHYTKNKKCQLYCLNSALYNTIHKRWMNINLEKVSLSGSSRMVYVYYAEIAKREFYVAYKKFSEFPTKRKIKINNILKDL